MGEGQIWRQYVIASFACLAVVTTGYTMGWTSPVNPKLQNATESPLPAPVTSDQEAWVGSLLTIGAIFGPFFGGLAAAQIGRKWGLMSTCIPVFAGWVLVAAATDVAFIYAGRILWGIGVGMNFTLTPMYCAEISTTDARGALGSFLQVFISLGFLLIYGVGPFVSYSAVAYIGVACVALFAVCFYFMPETPIYHLTKNDKESAAECLAIIRGKSRQEVEDEISKMHEDVQASLAKTATIADLFRGNNFKAFYISSALVFFQQFSGINAVLFYMSNIFEAAGSDLDPAISTIIVGAVQVVASLITPLVADRLGRRMLLMISAGGMALGQIFLGMFFLLEEQDNPVVANIGFLPILSVMVFVVSFCWGLGPLTWAVMSELLPIEVKAVAAPIATAFCWVFSFLVTRYFGPVGDAVGMHWAFWIFGACCLVGFVFILVVVPETKNKSFAEIQEILAGRSNQEKALA